MKKTVYLLCLIITLLMGTSIFVNLFSPLVTVLLKIPGGIHVFSIIIQISSSFIPLLVVYRFLVFIKSRSFRIPSNFSGWTVAFAYIALAPAVITIVGYIYFIVSEKSWISGVPLGMVLVFSGLISVVIVIYCEVKEFYSIIPSDRA